MIELKNLRTTQVLSCHKLDLRQLRARLTLLTGQTSDFLCLTCEVRISPQLLQLLKKTFDRVPSRLGKSL